MSSNKDTSEARFELSVIEYLESRGALAEHLIGSKGQPDLVCVYRGKYIAIEIKAPSTYYKASVLQMAKLARIRSHGGLTLVMSAIADVADLLDRIDEGAYNELPALPVRKG